MHTISERSGICLRKAEQDEYQVCGVMLVLLRLHGLSPVTNSVHERLPMRISDRTVR